MKLDQFIQRMSRSSLDINDYDLLENPQEIESIIERIGNSMEQAPSLKK